MSESYREFVRRSESGKSYEPRQCVHCGEMGRGLIGAPRGGWIHPECLKNAIAAYKRSWPRNFWK
jgi:hypothetical protein